MRCWPGEAFGEAIDQARGAGLDVDLKWPWAPVVIGLVVVGLLLWWARRPRAPRSPDTLLVAHTAALFALPRFRALVRRRRLAGALLTVAALVVVTGVALVLARPQTVESQPRESRARDLMLCLDASTSMDHDNVRVIQELRQIVGSLPGDRVGMVMWSGAAVLVFPLTDDYQFVDAELARAEEAFAGRVRGFFEGIDAVSGASLIGDGIVSCVNRFDRPASERTRAVIVSSDNAPRGTPVYELAQAADYAANRKVRVYGLGATALAQPEHAAARQGFADAATVTGGRFVVVNDQAAAQVADRIDSLEQARAMESPRQVSYDDPGAGLVTTGVGLALLALAWCVLLASRPRKGGAR